MQYLNIVKRTRWYNMHMKWSCWSSNSFKKCLTMRNCLIGWPDSVQTFILKKKTYSFVENKEVFQLTCTCNNSCQYWNSKWRHTTHILPTAWSEYKLSSNNLCKLRHRPSGRVGENWLYDKSLCQCLLPELGRLFRIICKGFQSNIPRINV